MMFHHDVLKRSPKRDFDVGGGNGELYDNILPDVALPSEARTERASQTTLPSVGSQHSRKPSDSLKLASLAFCDSGKNCSSVDFGESNSIAENVVPQQKDQTLLLAALDVRRLHCELEHLSKSAAKWHKQELGKQQHSRLEAIEKQPYTNERRHVREIQYREWLRFYTKYAEVQRELEEGSETSAPNMQLEPHDSRPASPVVESGHAEQSVDVWRTQQRILLGNLKCLNENGDAKIYELQKKLMQLEENNRHMAMECRSLLAKRKHLETQLRQKRDELEQSLELQRRMETGAHISLVDLLMHEDLLTIKEREILELRRNFKSAFRDILDADAIHWLSVTYHSEITQKTTEVAKLKGTIFVLQHELMELQRLRVTIDAQQCEMEQLQTALAEKDFEISKLQEHNSQRAQEILQLKAVIADYQRITNEVSSGHSHRYECEALSNNMDKDWPLSINTSEPEVEMSEVRAILEKSHLPLGEKSSDLEHRGVGMVGGACEPATTSIHADREILLKDDAKHEMLKDDELDELNGLDIDAQSNAQNLQSDKNPSAALMHSREICKSLRRLHYMENKAMLCELQERTESGCNNQSMSDRRMGREANWENRQGGQHLRKQLECLIAKQMWGPTPTNMLATLVSWMEALAGTKMKLEKCPDLSADESSVDGLSQQQSKLDAMRISDAKGLVSSSCEKEEEEAIYLRRKVSALEHSLQQALSADNEQKVRCIELNEKLLQQKTEMIAQLKEAQANWEHMLKVLEALQTVEKATRMELQLKSIRLNDLNNLFYEQYVELQKVLKFSLIQERRHEAELSDARKNFQSTIDATRLQAIQADIRHREQQKLVMEKEQDMQQMQQRMQQLLEERTENAANVYLLQQEVAKLRANRRAESPDHSANMITAFNGDYQLRMNRYHAHVSALLGNINSLKCALESEMQKCTMLEHRQLMACAELKELHGTKCQLVEVGQRLEKSQRTIQKLEDELNMSCDRTTSSIK